eukprot:31138-Pelagococcus_subviridis.AAC.5
MAPAGISATFFPPPPPPPPPGPGPPPVPPSPAAAASAAESAAPPPSSNFSGNLNPSFKMSMFCCPSYANGRAPSTRLRERLHLRPLFRDQIQSALIRVGDEQSHLLVDELRGVLRVGLLELLIVAREGQHPDLLVHAVHRDAVVRHLRHLLEVVLRARGYLPEHHFLRGATAQRHAHHVRELLRRREKRLRVLEHPSHDRVPGFVIRHGVPLHLVHDFVLLLQPRDDAIRGLLKVRQRHRALVRARGDERRLVHDVRDVRAAEPGRQRREPFAVVRDVGVELDLPEVHAENLISTFDVRAVHGDLTVEPSRAHERAVQDVRSVRPREHDDALLRSEPVHLDEELVQRVLSLVVPAHHPAAAALPADGVDLVDEDDRGRLRPRLREEIAHAAWPDADEHLHEVRAADAEKRHPGLARGGLGEERLARTGRAHEERAARNLRAEVLVLLRALQKVDKLHDLRLGLVAPGDVFEHDLVLGVLIQRADGRLADVEDAA